MVFFMIPRGTSVSVPSIQSDSLLTRCCERTHCKACLERASAATVSACNCSELSRCLHTISKGLICKTIKSLHDFALETSLLFELKPSGFQVSPRGGCQDLSAGYYYPT
jgi:hypothetical protein